MNTPTPALVTQRAVQRLPRWALLLFCAAYVLPGLFGRDPWRHADLTAFGAMVAMADGRVSWLAPSLGGLPLAGPLLPNWIGASFIAALSPLVDPTLAARLPFALLLALTLTLTWYATFQLARTTAAQPVAFAFGGEAAPVDYARAVADGGVLALVACLGLLQLGHETTPELVQLCAVALLLWALAAAPYQHWRPRLAVLLGLPLLVASGAPAVALGVGVLGAVICARSSYPQARSLVGWLAATTGVSALLAWVLHGWAWRWGFTADRTQLLQLARLTLWFLWPAWFLALWTLWRWRQHLAHRHIAVPLCSVALALVTCIAMGGSDRALMLGLPGFAVLAAFALPTLQRRASAMIDWFSVFFFSLCALSIWVIYGAMQLGVPTKIAANVARLAPGFQPRFSAIALVFAVLGTLAWLWLVRWRTSRHRHALWKTLVLPAGGVALSWLLLMTLWLPLLDYARSYRPWVQLLALHIPADTACLSAPTLRRSAVAALEHFGRWRVNAVPGAERDTRCGVLLVAESIAAPAPTPAGLLLVARVRRPTDSDESTAVFKPAPASPR